MRVARHRRHKRLITFSLWGGETRYLEGAVENARLAAQIYPGWIARYYCAPDVTGPVRAALREAGAELVDMETPTSPWYGLCWRFLAIDDPTIERMISRDTDSRLNPREAACVRRWEETGRAFHVMRDHPFHDVPIPGGMFGCRGGAIDMRTLLACWQRFDRKGCDQDFLGLLVWPLVASDHLAHDELHELSGAFAEPFPAHAPMQYGSFVGEPVAV